MPPGAATEILEKFLQGSSVVFPRHPFNRSTDANLIPFLSEVPFGHWRGRLTASRSIIVLSDDGSRYLFSVKLPTNFIGDSIKNSRDGFLIPQVMKLNMKTELIESRRISDKIVEIDRRLGSSPDLIILQEVLSIRDKGTGNGLVVRDIEPLRSGYFYLPAFSLPTVGRAIAKKFRRNFGDFWKPSFASLGAAEALINVKYNMCESNQSPQNWKIELDTTFRPTGRLVLIDTGDWYTYLPNASITGNDGLPGTDRFRTPSRLMMFIGLDMGYGRQSISPSTIAKWEAGFLEGYRENLQSLLGVPSPFVKSMHGREFSLTMQSHFTSPEVKRALRRFHASP